jgi:hypothetical protein
LISPAAIAFFDISQGVAGSANNCTSEIADVGNSWYRCSITFTPTAASSAFSALIGLATTDTGTVQVYTGDGESGIFIWGAQLEVGSTATEYFPTNIGEPRFDWASTDSTGAGTIADPRVIPLRANPTSNGILIEEARTNRLLWNRDATQTEWVKTNITAVKDQIGIDGVANAASSLTATDDNGTCIQTITLGAGNRTGSVYLKRLTGTGLIQVTLDGSTYSTVELSDTEWYRIVLSGSVTNPTVGIKIAVDGDAVAMDYGQVEDGLFATSPILTTAATATRAVDSASMSTNNWFNANKGTVRISFTGINPSNSYIIWYLRSPNSGASIAVQMHRLRVDSNNSISYRYATGSEQAIILFGNLVYSALTPYEITTSYSPSIVNGSLNNNINLTSNSSGSVPAGITDLFLSGSNDNKWLKRFIYTPTYSTVDGVSELSK